MPRANSALRALQSIGLRTPFDPVSADENIIHSIVAQSYGAGPDAACVIEGLRAARGPISNFGMTLYDYDSMRQSLIFVICCLSDT